MLTLDRIWKTYRVGAFGGRELVAVRDVSFGVKAGEVVSLIGESGSGKTTIGRMILGLAATSKGSITFDGLEVPSLRGRRLRDYRRLVQGVFQDPFSSYNPVFKAERVFALIRQGFFSEIGASEWRGRVDRSLEAVCLDPGQVLNKYPHQLSGGQLQRMLIARALLLDIRLLVADELTSMLDASTRIDVLNLLADLKARGLGVLFITHDLSLGNYISDQTVILRRGEIVEMGATGKVFGNPMHPYTRTLVASVPQLHRRWEPVPENTGSGARTTSCALRTHPACLWWRKGTSWPARTRAPTRGSRDQRPDAGSVTRRASANRITSLSVKVSSVRSSTHWVADSCQYTVISAAGEIATVRSTPVRPRTRRETSVTGPAAVANSGRRSVTSRVISAPPTGSFASLYELRTPRSSVTTGARKAGASLVPSWNGNTGRR
jgi:peptide/nickel transport system ATP-binding protein